MHKLMMKTKSTGKKIKSHVHRFRVGKTQVDGSDGNGQGLLQQESRAEDERTRP